MLQTIQLILEITLLIFQVCNYAKSIRTEKKLDNNTTMTEYVSNKLSAYIESRKF